MISKLRTLSDSPDFKRWFALGRATRIPDGQGNELTLVEMLAQAVEEQAWLQATAPSSTISAPALILGAGRTIRHADDTITAPKSMPKPSYGVDTPEYPPPA